MAPVAAIIEVTPMTNHNTRRPEGVRCGNGQPLAVVEIKNAVDFFVPAETVGMKGFAP